jgi:MoaA/NifB/PqqE/SkfB family radical SAM enzyme
MSAAGPRYPLEGVASWNMNTTCNYRCSYCTQRFVDDRGQWASDLPRFIAAFAALAGDWEIKLSGGEPFRHPDFIETVQALAGVRRRVSVVTNFASPLAELCAFVDATRDRPGLLSASLHLEYAEPDAFLDKALAVQAHGGRVVTTCVATRANLPRLEALRDQFAAAGITFRIQPEKQDRDVIEYDAAERDQLVQLGGHNGTGEIAPSFAGQPCWAGARYFIADHRGEAYRCYPARRHRREYLGNLLDGTFRLRQDAEPCRYSYCNCTVPQQRGMVEMRRT